MFQNGQKVVVVSSGDPARVIKVQAASSLDTGRYPTVDTTGVTGRDQQVQIVSGGDETRFPKLQGLADARSTADTTISALTPAAWYRNATGVTSAGGFASQWDDYSGNTRHLVQLTGTNQPAYNATGGIFTFDGADNFMDVSFALTQPTTIYMVLNPNTWTGSDNFCDGATNLTGWVYQSGVTPNVQLYAGTAPAAANTTITVGAYHIVCVVFNGASSSLRADNSAKTTGNPGAGSMAGFTLAGNGNGAANSNILVKEVVIFNAAHDDATQSSVITALNNALTVF